METLQKTIITVENTINAPLEKVWEYWTRSQHIIQWNYASDDWHTPRADMDLRVGGRYIARMEAKDGSMGFDFGGTINAVTRLEYLEYTLDDDRKVSIHFTKQGSSTMVTENFEAENTNPPELQKAGWQIILDNFKKYTETA